MRICKSSRVLTAVVTAIVMAVLTSQGFADLFEDPDLIAHWALDDGSGQVASDASSNDLDLQLGSTSGADAHDPSWAARGVEFEAGDYITSAGDENLLDLDVEDPFTLAAWVKRPAGSPYGFIMCKSEDSAPHYRGWGFVVRGDVHAGGEDRIEFLLRHSQTDPSNQRLYVHTTDADPIDTTDWTHVAVTYDGSTDASGVAFYVNGASVSHDVNSDNLDPGETTVNDRSFNIGGRNDVGNYVGLIDDAAIWGRVLTEQEIALLGIAERLMGDANLDGIVDVSDLGILATNYGAGGGFGWSDADFTGDGAVDVSDLGILATNYGSSSQAAASVPEPGAFVFLAGAVFGIFIYRRRDAR